ncbi:purple acid phosphatase 8-like [Andrographis paniculata]|uniref:purple acid phosphatase 8-like n=1 Tax=Andrographis paniculata TaxID=175694 RepID=UPI0021E944AF|nr:purple acid phosphatase 8-like [Andrographis paniculata]
MAMGNTAAVLTVFLFLWSLKSRGVLAVLPRLEYVPRKGDGSIAFLVVGDWGRKGHYNQSRVASQMGRVGEELEIDFVVSTGDNFYDDGLKSEDDAAFLQSYSKIYTARALQEKPWFSVLGNHDYRGDVLAQLSPALRRIDSRWLCLRSFVVDADVAELFFVDTTPFVSKYFTDTKDHKYDWRGVLPLNTYIAPLLKDLDSALRESNAKWKILVGHHPIRSVGHHGDTQELIDQLLPILEANNVDLYVNGHDHCLEHIKDTKSGIHYLTSGGGSKAWRGGFDIETELRGGLKFYHDGQGFMSVYATLFHIEVAFYDVSATILHNFTLTNNPHYSLL